MLLILIKVHKPFQSSDLGVWAHSVGFGAPVYFFHGFKST